MMDQVYAQLFALDSKEGSEYIVQVRFRAASGADAREVALAVQELIPEAGVSVLCHVGGWNDGND